MKIAPWVLIASLIFPLQIAVAGAQQSDPTDAQQGDPLAAAARKTQEQKKTESKPAKVWDNDHMPTGTINVIGQTPAPASDQDANAAATVPPTGGTADQSKSAAPTSANAATLRKEQRAALQANLESAKQQVESLKTELDISQRKYDLDRQSFTTAKAGLTRQTKRAAQRWTMRRRNSEAKLQELSDAQKHVDDLQAQIASARSAARPIKAQSSWVRYRFLVLSSARIRTPTNCIDFC